MVRFQAGHDQVEEPQADEENCGRQATPKRPAQFAAQSPAEEEDSAADEGADAEECHRVGETARVNGELLTAGPADDGGQCPGDADAQEDVHCIAAGDVADGAVGVLVILSGHLAGECVWLWWWEVDKVMAKVPRQLSVSLPDSLL